MEEQEREASVEAGAMEAKTTPAVRFLQPEKMEHARVARFSCLKI